MASIWVAEAKSEPRKLKGHIPADAVIAAFTEMVGKVAKRYGLQIELKTEMDATLRGSNGKRCIMFIEPCSPPSAPEVGQPKVTGKKGVVVTKDGTVHDLVLP